MRRWRLEVEADPFAARIVRRTFEAWLASMDCGEDDWLDARLALSELVTIAIRETVEPIVVTATHEIVFSSQSSITRCSPTALPTGTSG